MRRPARPTALAFVLAALLVLLAVLAVLQHRWLAEGSAAERELARTALERSARGFTEDFDRELTRALLHFQLLAGVPDLDGTRGCGDALDAWAEIAPTPELVSELLLLHRQAGGPAELERCDPEANDFRPVPMTPDVEALGRRIGELRPGVEPIGAVVARLVLADDLPAVVMPRFGGRLPPRDRRERGPHLRQPRDLVVVRLDAAVIFESFLPRLAERYFGDGEGLAYHLVVVAKDGPQRLLWSAGPEPGGARRADVKAELYGLLSPDEIRRLMFDLRTPTDDGRWRRGRFAEMMVMGAMNLGELRERRWRLEVTHPAGSLEAAYGASRRRELAVGTVVLVLLGAAAVLLVVLVRRTMALARRELEFVAGITHELKTPLAAMRSAGENLADGVVREPEQVARYGRLVEREGRRLTDLVEQVLEYAGLESGQRRQVRRRTSVQELVDEAVDAHRALLDERGLEVEVGVESGLLDVIGDRAALVRALGNLLANAAKYAAAGGWVGVRAKAVGDGVEVAVSDRGPGIAAADLPHVFEPFYRGRELAAGNVPGSGLGLGLVRHVVSAHGGKVEVSSRPGKGTTFTLRLPAAPAGTDVPETEPCEA